MADRSCGTCRDRRILCDRTLPICTRCSESNRTCKGYSLRLSWPKANDGRRAVVGKAPLQKSRVRRFSDSRLIGVSPWDIEMHYYLSGAVPNNYTQMVLSIPMPFNTLGLGIKDSSLFQYFQCTASRSLTTFGHDSVDVGNILIRIALANTTPSATAVLQSMLAVSSLHRYGLQSQAAELKISALKALAAASKCDIGAMEATQHVAACMLLCSFEIHQASCTSGQWEWYIDGIKNFIKATSLGTFNHDSYFTVLMDWVNYHDVLARFSVCHWRRENTRTRSSPSSIYPENSHASPSPFATLQLLSEVCDAVSARPSNTGSAEDLDDYKGFLKILEWRIRSISISDTVNDTPDTTILELFQLATLVYLDRASGNLLDQPAETQKRIERAFAIFSELSSCERQFPLFVLGCEARTDDERVIILDIICRTEKKASSRSYMQVKKLIQAIWVQDDLSNKELDYMDKLNAIISCCSILPTFV